MSQLRTYAKTEVDSDPEITSFLNERETSPMNVDTVTNEQKILSKNYKIPDYKKNWKSQNMETFFNNLNKRVCYEIRLKRSKSIKLFKKLIEKNVSLKNKVKSLEKRVSDLEKELTACTEPLNVKIKELQQEKEKLKNKLTEINAKATEIKQVNIFVFC